MRSANPVIKYSEAMHCSIHGMHSRWRDHSLLSSRDEGGKRKYQISSRPAIEMSIALARN